MTLGLGRRRRGLSLGHGGLGSLAGLACGLGGIVTDIGTIARVRAQLGPEPLALGGQGGRGRSGR